jgi:hypothetical protein
LAGNESVFSIWLSSALQLRGLPVLPLVSLSCAALLGVIMMLKNRGQKGAKARTGK